MDTKIDIVQQYMSSIARSARSLSPGKLAHFIYLTDDIARLRDWYVKVLNATPAIENEMMCMLKYDDEHHRIGFVKLPDMRPMPAYTGHLPLVEHVAFGYASLDQLFGTYLRLRDEGIEPYWCMNHGPTTSLYYKDPDGHKIELLVDTFSTPEEVDAFFAAGHYVENPIGIIFDPMEWITRLAHGEPIASVTRRPKLPPGMSPFDMIRE